MSKMIGNNKQNEVCFQIGDLNLEIQKEFSKKNFLLKIDDEKYNWWYVDVNLYQKL